MSKFEKGVRKYIASKAVTDLNPEFFGITPGSMIQPSKPVSNDPGAIARHSIRQSTDESKLNKTEQSYLRYLRSNGNRWVGVQCVSLKLGDDCRYNPDFLVLNDLGFLELHEVKGFMREDALVKLKVVARMYRFFKVVLVRKDRESWSFQEVKP